ncbi:MAG: ComEC/Rec2 family competence protein [Verrucomicrobiota bacterium]
MRRSPLLPVALAALVGIIGSDRNSWWILIGGPGAMVLLGLAAHRLRLPSRYIWWATAISLIAYSQRQTSMQAQAFTFPLAQAVSEGQAVEIQGTGWIAARPSHHESSVSAVVRVTEIRIGGTRLSCNHTLPAWIQHALPSLRYGTEIEFSGLIRPLEGPVAPGGFDPAGFYFRELGALAKLEIGPAERLEITGHTRGSKLVGFSQQLRDRLEFNLHRALTPQDQPYASLIAAMSLGARENSPDELENWFRLSGTMHLFAVSGLHVGIVAGMLLSVALLVGLPKRWAALLVIPAILFYALLTGLRPSAVRAAIMLTVVLASFIAKEQPRLLNSLSFAGLLLLAIDPQQAFLPGFQLSFAVLLSIILLGQVVQKFLARPWLSDPFVPQSLLGPTRRFKNRFVTWTTAALSISLVSWLGSLGPLSWHFHSFSTIGILANVIMVPLASIIVMTAAGSLTCFAIKLTSLGGLLNQVNVFFALCLTSLAQFFANVPGAYRHTGIAHSEPPSASAMIDIMGQRGELGILITNRMAKANRERRWMIDCGAQSTYQRQLLPLLRSRGINQIDALILTHGDKSHLGSAPEILSQMRPHLLLESGFENRSALYPQIDGLANALNIERRIIAGGQRLVLGDELIWEVIAPRASEPEEFRFADDRSLVLKLNVQDWKILFTSDAGFETEKAMMESGIQLDADLWIRSQHRGTPSALPAFVSAVAPRVVISTHSDFPSNERLSPGLREQLNTQGATLFTLDQTGVVTVLIHSDRLEIIPFAHPAESVTIR